LQRKTVVNVMNKINDKNWKHRIRIIVGMVCIGGCFFWTNVGFGQTANENAPVATTPAANPVVGEEAAPASKALESVTGSDLSQPQPSLQLPANQVPLQADGESQKDPRLKGIFDRIKLLNKIIEEDKNLPESSEITPNPTPSELIFGNPLKPEATPVENPAVQPDPAVAPESQPPAADPPEITGGSQVLAEPVNSLELGNSLYMTANYPAAIRSYSMLLNQEMDNQEAAWLRLMLGCCYRYQDDYINAESIFRNVADRRGAGDFLMKHTTWNLQYLEERRKRRDEFLAVETELDALLLEINNEPTQK